MSTPSRPSASSPIPIRPTRPLFSPSLRQTPTSASTSARTSPSSSPSRRQRTSSLKTLLESDPLLSKLTPSNIKDLVQDPQLGCTEKEKEVAILAAEVAEKIHTWTEEVQRWEQRWKREIKRCGNKGVPGAGFLEVDGKRQKLDGVDEEDELRPTSPTHIENETTLQEEVEGDADGIRLIFSQTYTNGISLRIKHIQEALATLPIAYLKSVVLSSHLTTPKSPSRTETLTPAITILTATILQLLPPLHALSRLLSTWSVRTSLLTILPTFLTWLRHTEMDLASASIQLDHIVENHEEEGWKERLETEVRTAGRLADSMLDVLDGREDVLPEVYLERLEVVEEGVTEWGVKMVQQKVEREVRDRAREERRRKEALREEEGRRREQEVTTAGPSTASASAQSKPPSPPVSPTTSEFGLLMSHSQLLQKANLETANAQNHLQQIQQLDGTLAQILQNANSQDLPELGPSTPPSSHSGHTPSLGQALEQSLVAQLESEQQTESNQSSSWNLPLQLALGAAAWGGDGTPSGTPSGEREHTGEFVASPTLAGPGNSGASPDSDTESSRRRGRRRSGRNSPGPGIGLGIVGGLSRSSSRGEEVGDSTILQQKNDEDGELLFPVEVGSEPLEDAPDLDITVSGAAVIPGIGGGPIQAVSNQPCFPSHWSNTAPTVPHASRPQPATTSAPTQTSTRNAAERSATFTSHWDNRPSTSSPAATQSEAEEPTSEAAPTLPEATGSKEAEDPLPVLLELQPNFASHWGLPASAEQAKEAKKENSTGLSEVPVEGEALIPGAIVEERSRELSQVEIKAESSGFKSHWDPTDSTTSMVTEGSSTEPKSQDRREEEIVEGFKKHWASVGDSATATATEQVPPTSVESTKSQPPPPSNEGFKSHWDARLPASGPDESTQSKRATDLLVGLGKPKPENESKNDDPATSKSKFKSHWELVDSGVIPSTVVTQSPLAPQAPNAPEQPQLIATANTELKHEQPKDINKESTSASRFASHWGKDNTAASNSSPPSQKSTSVAGIEKRNDMKDQAATTTTDFVSHWDSDDDTTQTRDSAVDKAGTQTTDSQARITSSKENKVSSGPTGFASHWNTVDTVSSETSEPKASKAQSTPKLVEQPKKQEIASGTGFASHWGTSAPVEDAPKKQTIDVVVGLSRPKSADNEGPKLEAKEKKFASHWDNGQGAPQQPEVKSGAQHASSTMENKEVETSEPDSQSSSQFASHWATSQTSTSEAIPATKQVEAVENVAVTAPAPAPNLAPASTSRTGGFPSHWDTTTSSAAPTALASTTKEAEKSAEESSKEKEEDSQRDGSEGLARQPSAGQFASHWDAAENAAPKSAALEDKAIVASDESKSSQTRDDEGFKEVVAPSASHPSTLAQYGSHWAGAFTDSKHETKEEAAELQGESADSRDTKKEEEIKQEETAEAPAEANTANTAPAYNSQAGIDRLQAIVGGKCGTPTEPTSPADEREPHHDYDLGTSASEQGVPVIQAPQQSEFPSSQLIYDWAAIAAKQGVPIIKADGHFMNAARTLDLSSFPASNVSSIPASPIEQSSPIGERAHTPEVPITTEQEAEKPNLLQGAIEAEDIVKEESMKVETPTVPLATDAHVAELDKILKAREDRIHAQEATRREMERKDAERLQKRLLEQERRRIENETELEKRLRERHEKLHGKKKGGIELGPVEPEPEPMKLKLDLNRSKSVKEAEKKVEGGLGRSKSQRETERGRLQLDVKLKPTVPQDEKKPPTPLDSAKEKQHLDVKSALAKFEQNRTESHVEAGKEKLPLQVELPSQPLMAVPEEEKKPPTPLDSPKDKPYLEVKAALAKFGNKTESPIEAGKEKLQLQVELAPSESPIEAGKKKLQLEVELPPQTGMKLPSPLESPHLSVPSTLPSPQLSLSPDLSFSRDDVSDRSSHILRKQHSDSLLAISFREETIDEGLESHEFYADSSDNGIPSPFPQISVMESPMEMDNSFNFDSSPDRSFGELLEPLDEGSPAVSDTGSVVVRRPVKEKKTLVREERGEKWNHTFPRMLDSIKEVLTPRKEVQSFSLELEKEPPPKLDFGRAKGKGKDKEVGSGLKVEAEPKPLATKTLARSKSYDERLGQRKAPTFKGALTREELRRKMEEEKARAKVLDERLQKGDKVSATSTPTHPSLKEGPWPDLQPTSKLTVERRRPRLGARSATEQPPSPERSRSRARPQPKATATATRVPSAGLGRGDALDRKVDSIVKSLPSTVKLTASSLRKLDAANNLSNSDSSSNKYKRPSGPGVYIPPPRAPSVAGSAASAAPTVQKQRKYGNAVSSEIKLYHLHRSDGLPPIKLFVRMVGERGERVMVRVGGGWADLEEYLIEYASHHGTQRRVMSEGHVEISDVAAGTKQRKELSKMRSTASFRSNTSGAAESRPVTPTGVKTRSRAASRVSLGSRPATPTNMGRPQTPLTPRQASIPRPSSQAGSRRPSSSLGTPAYRFSSSRNTSPNRTPNGSFNKTPPPLRRTTPRVASRPVSRLSFAETFEAANQLVHITGEQIIATPSRHTPGQYSSMSLGRIRTPSNRTPKSPEQIFSSTNSVANTPLGLAGPKGKKNVDDIGEEGRRWVEGMMGRVRRASGALQPMTGQRSVSGGAIPVAGVLTYGVSSGDEEDIRENGRDLPVEDLGVVGSTRRVFIRGGEVRRE